MKYILLIVLLSNVLLLSQTGKKEKLDWVKSRGDVIVTEEGNDIYRFEYPGGKIDYKYLGESQTKDTSHIPTTVIDTWNIDTTLYEDMYEYWQEVPVSTSSTNELAIGDVNKNGYPEVYGYSKDYGEPLGLPAEIFEMDSTGYFIHTYNYPDSISSIVKISDIDNDGNSEVCFWTFNWNNAFYKTDGMGGLPIIPDFVYTLYPGQKDDIKFGDFDKNGITDLLFYADNYRDKVISEYNSAINNFETVFVVNDTTGYYQGFAVGDFDMDSKTDIVYASIESEVFVIEAEKEHTYNLVWEKDIVGSNSHMYMFTNDIDKNGKPEFWVSSTTDNGITDITRFTCFEYTGDNEYKEISRIDFLNMFPFYASNAFPLDVDKDGTEELVICLDDHLFILKFKGAPNNPQYEIFYMRRNNLPTGAYFGTTMYDLDRDGYEELLIHQDITDQTGDGRHFTQIFKPDFLVSVDDKNQNIISGYSLAQNYPNPFNPITSISYYLPKRSNVSLKIFDVLGNEIALIDEGERTEGKHSVQWNGKDKFQKQVNSGIYFFNLETPEYKKTIKGVLLK